MARGLNLGLGLGLGPGLGLGLGPGLGLGLGLVGTSATSRCAHGTPACLVVVCSSRATKSCARRVRGRVGVGGSGQGWG